MSEQTILEGRVAVLAALEAGSRDVERVLIAQNPKKRDRANRHLARVADSAGVAVEWTDRDHIERHTDGSTHGGVIALVGPRHFSPLEALLVARDAPFVVMLDGIEDPYNFGYATRALYAAGVDGLVVRPRNWMSAAAVVARASAGATERVLTTVAETALDAACFFRDHGFTVACTAVTPGAVSLYEADLTAPLFMLIGGERRGITRSFVKQADLLLQIPYGQKFEQSLGTGSDERANPTLPERGR